MKAYISSDGRFTRRKKPWGGIVFGGSSTMTIYVNTQPIAGPIFDFTTAYPDPSPDDDLPDFGWSKGLTFTGTFTLAEHSDLGALWTHTPAPERWYLAWSDPATGEEGRTDPAQWNPIENVPQWLDAMRGLYPHRLWWPVKEP